MKIRYRLVFNRKHMEDSLGRSLVQVEARQGSRKKYFSTGVYVRKEEWDGVVVNHPNATELNAFMLGMLVNLESIELDLWKHGVEPTLEHIKQGYSQGCMLTEFESYARKIIEHSSRKRSTKDNLIGTIRKVEAYRTHTNITDIDCAWLEDFEYHLRKQGLHPNSINKQVTNILTILNSAKKHGLIKDDSYKNYQKPKIEYHKKDILTERELERIKKLDIFPEVCQAMVFTAHTGIRFSDYRNLDKAKWERRGEKVILTIKTLKTGSIIRLPLHLLGAADLPHPPIPCNSETNRCIKAICEKAKIDKHITFHSLRHYFASYWINKGLPTEIVRTMLGHADCRITNQYIQVSDRGVEDNLRKVSKKTVQALHTF